MIPFPSVLSHVQFFWSVEGSFRIPTRPLVAVRSLSLYIIPFSPCAIGHECHVMIETPRIASRVRILKNILGLTSLWPAWYTEYGIDGDNPYGSFLLFPILPFHEHLLS